MLNDAVVFLKDCLNTYVKTRSGVGSSSEDTVVFLEDKDMEIAFKENAVSVMLINIEEEKTLRNADPYIRHDSNGKQHKINPDIRLNLYILFVARFKNYDDALKQLSWIIQYFQTNRIIDHQTAPQLHADIDQLILELITLPFAEQNEVWNSLRVAYHPSVLYKVKMLVFRDENEVDVSEISQKELRTSV